MADRKKVVPDSAGNPGYQEPKTLASGLKYRIIGAGAHPRLLWLEFITQDGMNHPVVMTEKDAIEVAIGLLLTTRDPGAVAEVWREKLKALHEQGEGE